MHGRSVIFVVLVVFAGLCGDDGTAAARERGPGLLVVSAKRGKGRDLMALTLGRRSRPRYLTRDGADKTGLRCLGDGKTLVYVSADKVWSLDVSGDGAKSHGTKPQSPRVLADLPKGLAKALGDQVGRLLAPSSSSRFLSVPHARGLFLVDLDSGKGRLVRPTCSLEGTQADGASSRRPADKPCPGGLSDKLVYVHPVFWAFKQERFLFVAMKPHCPVRGTGSSRSSRGRAQAHGQRSGGTESGNRVRMEVLAGLYDVDSGKTLACVRLGRGIEGPVTGLDASWRDDGKALALSVGTAGSGTLQRVVDIREVGGKVTLRAARPRRLAVGRFHGWRGLWLTATARRGRLVGLWRWKPGSRRKPVRIRALAQGQRVTVYEPSLRSFLLEVPGRKGCSRTRLLVVRRERRSRALFKWAIWSRLLTRDWSGRWGLFQVGAGCGRGKVRVLVSRLDGRRIRWTSRRHRRLARDLAPGRAALCTVHK